MNPWLLLAAGLVLLRIDGAVAFHDSPLDPQTKQALMFLESQVGALGNSLAAAQQRCRAGDGQACQWEQQLRGQLGYLQQVLGAAGGGAAPPSGPAGGNYGGGSNQPFGGFQGGPAPTPPQGGGGAWGGPPPGPSGGGGVPVWDQPRQQNRGQGQ